MCINHGLTGFANTNGARLTKSRAWDEKRAPRIKDLSTCTAMMLAAECCKRFSAVKAIFGVLVAHPEILAEQFTSHL
jgi:hypothetical protein